MSTLGRIASIWRHPVKGFTPEPLDRADLTAGAHFPCDRIYAVEDGPSGFDPAAPAFVSKQKFTVLAKISAVARARTRYDEARGELHVAAEGRPELVAALYEASGRAQFAAWLTDFLGGGARGPLQVVQAPGHHFSDHADGHVSIVNLASVRDLGARIERTLDPLRFRANLYVDGWPAWAENDWVDRVLRLGAARAKVFKPIVRCAATEVDPDTGMRDLDLVRRLHEIYGHMFCGVYVHVTTGGGLAVGDAAALEPIT